MAKKKVSKRLAEIGEAPSRTPMPPMPGRQDEAQLVELGMFISVTVLGTLLLVALAVFFGVRAVENHLESEALRAVDAIVFAAAEEDAAFRNITDVSADASGFDVHLRGTVDTEEMLATIPSLVERVEGIGTVTADLEWIQPISVDQPDIVAAPISLSWESGAATISGEVSDEATRTVVLEELDALFPNGVEASGFAVKEGAPSERDWISKILGVFRIGAESLSTGELYVSSGERLVQMSGEYATRQERREARDAVDELIGETTFAFVSSLSIPEAPDFTPEQVVELQESLDDLIEGKVVEFELNSDVLTPVGKALLDEILLALQKFPAVPIEIGGHTDNQGDPGENLDLSRRRAQTAFDYLVANGQDADRFVVVGYGEDVPIASNDTADGRARNRRIEFKALGE